MFSKECHHIVITQFEIFLVLVTNTCLSPDYCFVSFYLFPYTAISIVVTSPGECRKLLPIR